MRMSDRGLVALIRHEGIVPGPYRDAKGIWTFGIGHTAAAGPPDPARMPRGMPTDLEAGIRDAFRVFRTDLAHYEAEVRRAVTVPLAQHEFDALVSFHYNTGSIARAALTRHLNAGNRAAAAEAFLHWLRPVVLKPRREAERDLFRHGRYPTGSIPVWSVDPAGRIDLARPLRSLSEAQALALLTNTDRAAPVTHPAPTPSLPLPIQKGPAMTWTLTRGLVYLACLAASVLALAGLADFDSTSGTLDIRPFNLYALTGTSGGIVASTLASLALWHGWGRK
ncbi:lysozyme [Pannonibacter sp.]|uniref:lysozyme n=1 Tax=Pannonibacter sp. TaxID=1906786 RepID=UPI003F70EB34